MKKAIYPGSFDPFHKGHLDVIKKASFLFDKIYIVVTKNINKTPFYSFEKRVEIINLQIKDLSNVEVIINKNKLTTTIANELGAKFIIRGLRNCEDFENELQYYDGFKSLDNQLEVIYFISESDSRQISSSILREIEFYKNKIK